MTPQKQANTAVVGVGVAACAACCAGPILGVLAALGLSTAAGVALFGTVALLIGAVAVGFVLVRRRKSARCTRTLQSTSVAVTLTRVSGD